MGERPVEAAPRLDRRADDDEFRAALRSDARDLLAKASGPRADDLPTYGNPVRARHRCGGLQSLLEVSDLSVEMRVQRQLTLEDGGSDQHDLGSAIGSEPAGEVERVLGLLRVEQRHDDAPVGDRARPACETPRPATEESDVGELHRMR